MLLGFPGSVNGPRYIFSHRLQRHNVDACSRATNQTSWTLPSKPKPSVRGFAKKFYILTCLSDNFYLAMVVDGSPACPLRARSKLSWAWAERDTTVCNPDLRRKPRRLCQGLLQAGRLQVSTRIRGSCQLHIA